MLAWDQPEAFFARLGRRRAQLPVYQGECYLEYHRGTYTTHGELKSVFRQLERALQAREAAAVVCGRAPDLTAVWRRLVFAQFHDNIPGSSIPEVYAEGVPELRRLAREQFVAAGEELAAGAKSPAWQVFNYLPQPWRGWVRRSDEPPAWLQLAPLSAQPLANAAPRPPAVTMRGKGRGRTLANGRVEAEIDGDGWLRRLVFGGVETAFTGPAARAVLYADHPSNYDAWDIDRHALALGQKVAGGL